MVGVVVAAAGKSDVRADEEEFRSPRIGRSAMRASKAASTTIASRKTSSMARAKASSCIGKI